MQRGSDKHGPRQDEAMGHEVEGLLRSGHGGRAEEWRESEPPADDMDIDLVPDGTLVGGVPEGMTGEDVTGRAELATVLTRGVFPADTEQLISAAEENNAAPRILEELRGLPSDQQFDTVNDVWVALGHNVESRRF